MFRMNRHLKDMFLFHGDEIYAEAKRRIKECRAKKNAKLDFSHLNINTIPPEIAELKTLAELNLSNMDLKEIPGFIGNIHSLKKLLVGSEHPNIHHQPGNMTLPPELGNLHNLRYLSLGYGIPEIPEWVWGLEKLESLSIGNNDIEAIPAAIGQLKKLRKLRIYGGKINVLPDEIGNLPSLNILDLRCPELETLPESFSNLKTMEDFQYKSCNLTTIPDFICGWTKLKLLVIDIEDNSEGPHGKTKNLPKNMGYLTNLVYLSYHSARFTAIPDSLGDCPLGYLELTGNYKTLPETFGKLSKLEKLVLSSPKLRTLPESFGNLSALKNLEIRAARLIIPESFGALASLKDLSIMADDVLLPKTFGGLSSLEELSIYSRAIQTIPKSIGKCKNLKSVFVTSDKLTRLPNSFCELKKLKDLNLDTFALKSLPRRIGSLASLEIVHIFSGCLSALPESMDELKNIKKLRLDFHNLKKLPDWVKKIPRNAEVLVLTAKENFSLPLPKDYKKKSKFTDFSDLSKMSFKYQLKIIGTYPMKDIEYLFYSAPSYFYASDSDKELFKFIMLERNKRLNRRFKWTEENKKRIAAVSDEFLKAWEDGFAKVKTIIEALYEKDKVKESFKDKYSAIITICPQILSKRDEKLLYKETLYSIITDYLNPKQELSLHVSYDPETKDEGNFREHLHLCRDLSWNIEGFGDIELKDYYICYALHILYSHNEWAYEDIMNINNIAVKIELCYDN
ncbi:MAG: leucine-rich repeat protein [Treponema sp.]|nr:leucine-rich repeat protein [Treponema sp.]